MQKYWLYALVLILGIGIGAGSVYLFVADTAADNIEEEREEQQDAEVERLKDIKTMYNEGGIKYRNDRYGFSLEYPKGLVLKEFDEGSDSWTAVFQKPGEYVGFQIYITPNPGNTISGETILRDVPSGVVVDLQEEDIAVSSGKTIRAATFWSEAPLTGKNREIWFLHGGYIFEFTAYAPVDGWLREIMKTLEFEE